jgi:hypothetical protein
MPAECTEAQSSDERTHHADHAVANQPEATAGDEGSEVPGNASDGNPQLHASSVPGHRLG